MSVTTIQIPADHLEAVRESLIGRRDTLEEAGPAAAPQVAEIDALLGQLGTGAPATGEPCRLEGSRTALWNAIYDSLCSAAERLADDCNDYWRAGGDGAAARAGIASVGARLDLLEALGEPPVA